jgi:hypothetical protein
LPRFSGHFSRLGIGVNYEKNTSPYSPEFRQKMVDLVLSGRSPEDLEKGFEPSAISIRSWVAKSKETPKKRSTAPVDSDQQELSRGFAVRSESCVRSA